MQEENGTEEYVTLGEVAPVSTAGFWAKIKAFLTGRYFLPVIFVLFVVIAFALGRVSGLQEKREPVRVISNNPAPSVPLPSYPKRGEESNTAGEVKGASVEPKTNTSPSSPAGAESARLPAPDAAGNGGQVVASKNGTKYHYPWCGGAKQISEKNKVTFASIEEARAKGYTPAANCKGLK